MRTPSIIMEAGYISIIGGPRAAFALRLEAAFLQTTAAFLGYKHLHGGLSANSVYSFTCQCPLFFSAPTRTHALACPWRTVSERCLNTLLLRIPYTLALHSTLQSVAYLAWSFSSLSSVPVSFYGSLFFPRFVSGVQLVSIRALVVLRRSQQTVRLGMMETLL